MQNSSLNITWNRLKLVEKKWEVWLFERVWVVAGMEMGWHHLHAKGVDDERRCPNMHKKEQFLEDRDSRECGWTNDPHPQYINVYTYILRKNSNNKCHWLIIYIKI